MKTTLKFISAAFALSAFVCFAVLPEAQAVNPPPDGGYPGGNTAEGQNALLDLSTGGYNTAVGFFSLLSDTTGAFNTGIGAGTLLANTADQNTATGAAALLSNTIGHDNTADGAFALFSNTEGVLNTASGANALSNNTTGTQNTANGFFALGLNSAGNWNTASGEGALGFNQTGNENTACGQVALQNVTGSKNVGIGAGAGCKLTTGSNNIAIVNPGVPGESNTIRIGTVGTETNCANFSLPAHTATYIAGIYGSTTASGAAVYINSDGQLGTLTSSARFKTDIKPMDQSSEAILALKPVTFRYKQNIDPHRIPQFGLVAEEVEKVNPDLVARDRDGKPYSVRYEAVNAMLLNEFLKAHRKIDNLESLAGKQQKEIAALTAQLKDQAAQIQKVNDKIELRQPAAELVVNGR